jgi:hypothetical protein
VGEVTQNSGFEGHQNCGFWISDCGLKRKTQGGGQDQRSTSLQAGRPEDIRVLGFEGPRVLVENRKQETGAESMRLPRFARNDKKDVAGHES